MLPWQAAAAVLEAFPPRGGIALLPQEYVQGERTALEQLILQQYILDTLHYFDGDRVACARKLALGAASCHLPLLARCSMQPACHGQACLSATACTCYKHVCECLSHSQSHRSDRPCLI